MKPKHFVSISSLGTCAECLYCRKIKNGKRVCAKHNFDLFSKMPISELSDWTCQDFTIEDKNEAF